jgi:chromosome segregation ATPase
MKVQRIIIKNFRNIEDVEKEINGNNILLMGENGVGKSNFIKALEISLGITDLVGKNPIMNGKKEASIQTVMDDNGNEYVFEVKFKEGNDKPYITVKAPDGLKSTAKSVIGSIVGEIEFDIDKFVEMSKTEKGRKEQVEIVKSFLPAEVREQLRKYENHVKICYEERTEVNRRAKMLEGFIAESGLTKDDFDKYFLPEDAQVLKEQLTSSINLNQEIQKQESKRVEKQSALDRNVARIKQLEVEIKNLETENSSLDLDIDNIELWQQKKENQPVDISELQTRMDAVSLHNSKHEKITEIRKQEEKKEELQKQSQQLTIDIDKTRELISDSIKDAGTPVDGLSFTDEALTYNDRVVDESTLSTSEIMMLGVKLKMAKNPNAKILCIQRGESLGAQRLKDLQVMAKQFGYQIIMEEVQRGTEELHIEIMPDIEAVTA